MNLKRVVVTGLGALTPIGNTKDDYWKALLAGKSGCAPITYFDTEQFKTKFASELKNYNNDEVINNVDILLNDAVEKRLNIVEEQNKQYLIYIKNLPHS